MGFLLSLIDRLAQEPDVIRCRECRHRQETGYRDGSCLKSWYGRGGDADYFQKIIYDADKEFCSYGQRMDAPARAEGEGGK